MPEAPAAGGRLLQYRVSAIELVPLLGALLANRLLLSLLYQVSPTDPVTLAVVAALLPSSATLAILIPARSSTRIDPVQALRVEG